MVRVIHISEITSTKDLFEMRQFMLGDSDGEWFVVDDDLFLGRYVDKYMAEEHASSLTDDKLTTTEELETALQFAKELEDDKL